MRRGLSRRSERISALPIQQNRKPRPIVYRIALRCTTFDLQFHEAPAFEVAALENNLHEAHASVTDWILAAKSLCSRHRQARGQEIDLPCLDFGRKAQPFAQPSPTGWVNDHYDPRGPTARPFATKHGIEIDERYVWVRAIAQTAGPLALLGTGAPNTQPGGLG